jgi:menaquinol-cytochrome c reductase iron-sulfur subunit
MAAAAQPPSPTASKVAAKDDHRRGFFGKLAAVVVGGIVVIFPFAAGLAVFADPLRRRNGRNGLIRVASLDAVPTDGTPRKFAVIADRQDAWNDFPAEPIGAVYLRRVTKSKQSGAEKTEATDSKADAGDTPTIEALNVICPHAGCFVGFSDSRQEYLCPCHTSAFAIDGDLISGPSPRGLDKLECVVREEEGRKVVWVNFKNFYTGISDQKAKA